jgi:hypothetical protein
VWTLLGLTKWKTTFQKNKKWKTTSKEMGDNLKKTRRKKEMEDDPQKPNGKQP